MQRRGSPGALAFWLALCAAPVTIAVAQTTPPSAEAPKPNAPAIDRIKKVLVALGYNITSSTDTNIEYRDNNDDYEVSLSDDQADVYVSSWVDVPKGYEVRIPYAALLEYNNESRAYFSIGKSDDGSLYIGINDRIKMADVTATVLKEAMDEISGTFDDSPELTDPDKWK